MASVRRRIGKVEEHLRVNQKAPIEYKVIFSGAADAAEREQRAVSEYHARYGCLDGLRIVRTNVPPPLPVPSGFK